MSNPVIILGDRQDVVNRLTGADPMAYGVAVRIGICSINRFPYDQYPPRNGLLMLCK